MNETEKTLSELRKTVKESVRVNGIFLVARFRYEPSAKWVAETVKELGGTASVRKYGKMSRTTVQGPHGPYKTFTKDWVVEFTVGIEADQYLTGRVNMRGYREMLAFEAKKGEQAQQS